MKAPSVVFVSPYRSAGGPTTTEAAGSALCWYTSELSQAMSARACDVTVVGPTAPRAMPWSDEAVRIVPAYRRGHPLACAQILAAVRRTRSDVVHVQHELFAYGGAAAAFTLPLAMRYFGRPVVTTLHGVIPLDRIDRDFVRTNAVAATPSVVRTLWRRLVRSVAACSDVVHVHETEHATWLREQYGVTARIEVEPIGTRSAGDRLARIVARERLGIAAGARVVLFFGYLLERKGIVAFLESVDHLLATDPELMVVVAGKIPERVTGVSDTMGLIERLRSRERFRHLGFIADEHIAAVFAASDVVVFPYTFSMSASGSLALAVGAHRPVLLSETFRNAYPDAPLLFEPTVAGIVHAIGAFFSDAAARTRVDAFSSALAEGRTWPAMAQRMIDIYASLQAQPLRSGDSSETGASASERARVNSMIWRS